ncbi:MAG: hypothetical protein ACTSX9_00830 [Candidatus Njordarchaeales archaeon]
MKNAYLFPFFLILFAWLFLVLIIPIIAKFSLTIIMPHRLLTNIARVLIPLITFLLFLYLWYKLAEIYINRLSTPQ